MISVLAGRDFPAILMLVMAVVHIYIYIYVCVCVCVYLCGLIVNKFIYYKSLRFHMSFDSV